MFLTPLELQSDNGYWVALTDFSRHELFFIELPIKFIFNAPDIYSWILFC